MDGLKIVGVILLALFLFSFVRVGGAVSYGEEGLTAHARLGLFRIRLYPLKQRKKKEKPPAPKEKKKGEEKKKAPEKKPDPGGTLELVMECLPVAAEAAGRLRRKILIERIGLLLTWGSPDPAACAMGFGYANAAVGMLWPLFENNFTVREREIKTAVDFDLKSPLVQMDAALSLTIGQIFALSLALGLRALGVYRRHQKRKKTEKAV